MRNKTHIKRSGAFFILFLLLIVSCKEKDEVNYTPTVKPEIRKASNTIIIVADMWAPYTSRADSGSPGYIIEILERILKGAGYDIEYRVVPFSRGIMGIRNGSYDILAGLYKENAPDFRFTGKTFGVSINKCYVIKNDPWRYRKGPDSMKGRVLGVVQDYTYDELDAYIKINAGNNSKVQIVTGADPLTANINKLLVGRINVTIDDGQVVRSTLRMLGEKYEEAVIEAGVVGVPHNVYVALSPSPERGMFTDKIAAILDRGIDNLRKRGALKGILDAYGLSDWER